jgi:predicted negative regulator of RcsB-dependent stress response
VVRFRPGVLRFQLDISHTPPGWPAGDPPPILSGVNIVMSRKAELSENILAARMERTLTWVIERRVQALISLGVIVASILIGSVFVLRRNQQIEKSRTKLAYAQSLISQQEFAQAEPILNEIRASGTDADGARLAAFLSGVAALDQKKLDDAVKLLTEAVDKSSGHPIRPLARAALGTALEEKKDLTAAIANYAAFISETPDHFMSPRIQLALGRCNLQAGRNDDARRALEHLIDQFPTSEWAENARRLMDKNKSR